MPGKTLGSALATLPSVASEWTTVDTSTDVRASGGPLSPLRPVPSAQTAVEEPVDASSSEKFHKPVDLSLLS
jgi:hypothetical protein